MEHINIQLRMNYWICAMQLKQFCFTSKFLWPVLFIGEQQDRQGQNNKDTIINRHVPYLLIRK
jgi:hypothetical protein